MAGTTATINATGYGVYLLYYVTVSSPAWVRIYANQSSLTADSSRAQGTDPGFNSGVIAEFITTASNQTILVSPGILGYNQENPVTTNIPMAVTNNSATTQSITVTLQLGLAGGGTIAYTTASSGVYQLTAGTGTYISSSTGAVTIWTAGSSFNGGTVSGITTFTNQVSLTGSLTNNSLSTIMNNVGENVAIASTSLYSTIVLYVFCLLYTSPSPRDRTRSRMPSSA